MLKIIKDLETNIEFSQDFCFSTALFCYNYGFYVNC